MYKNDKSDTEDAVVNAWFTRPKLDTKRSPLKGIEMDLASLIESWTAHAESMAPKRNQQPTLKGIAASSNKRARSWWRVQVKPKTKVKTGVNLDGPIMEAKRSFIMR